MINFTFYETVSDEPIPHKNFTLLGQRSHEIPRGEVAPTPLVSDVGTNTLGNRRVNFGEDLSYFVILPYKLRDFIKIYDDYVNDPMKGDFQKTLLLFYIGRKSFVENKWLWLHTAHKSSLGLSSMIDNQTV